MFLVMVMVIVMVMVMVVVMVMMVVGVGNTHWVLLIMVSPKKRWRNCQELALPPMEWPGSGVLGHSAHLFLSF